MQNLQKRTAEVFCTMLALCAMLIGRLIILTTHSDYIAAAKNHSTYKLKLVSTRGKIYDRNGFALAGGGSSLKALIIPSPQTSAELMGTLPPEKYSSIAPQLKGIFPFTTSVSDGSCECNGVTVYRIPKRYSDHSLAVHLVGRCGENGGESGIERAYDKWLSDAKGEMTVTCRISASGRSLDGADRELIDTTGNSNCGIMLTIDSNIQNIAESAAQKHLECGAVIVSDISTGEILAMVSLPTYDRNNLAAYLNDKRSPLINRAIAEYNVGSVFKPVVAAAALESGADPNEMYHCTGSVMLGNVKMGCIKHISHGEVDLTGAISCSCNTYFINLSQKVGGDAILSMAQSLGFGSATKLGSRYSALKGNLPDSKTLCHPAELANLSFGQGSLTATPVQIAGMVASIAREGEYIEPYVVKGLTDGSKNLISQVFKPKRHRAMSSYTAKVIGKCMRTAVLDGTAKAGATDKVSSAAKTGTAETGIIRNGRRINQAWYAGFFPYESPRYVCVVLAENGVSGGGSAGPVFKEIAERMSVFE